MYRILLLLLLCIGSIGVSAQVVEGSKYKTGTPRSSSGLVNGLTSLTEWGIDLITIERENSTFFFLPVAGYENRTGLSIGLLPSWRFYLGGKEEGQGFYRPSNISVSGEFSTSGMYEFYLSSKFYTKNNWYLKTKWMVQHMPDKFYLLGNSSDKSVFSDIEENKLEFTGRIMKIVRDKWFLGVNYDFSSYNIKNIDGLVFNPSVRGYRDAWVAGVGPSVTYDNRNSVIYPMRGMFFESSYLNYFRALGDYDFSTFKFDYRTYVDLGKNEQVIAMQAVVKSTAGDVPFYRMSEIGGKRLFRGISHPYKYLDNHSFYVQAAFRSRLWWRLGCEVFSGVGNVFDKLGSSMLEDMHVMGGAGLRIRVLENEKLSFRIDYGMTNRGDSGVFFTLGEAF
ncbi:BamA/TamA family outer membrane protein [Plebeiibacterium marinum]|uniref:Outer membrane protein assembly factor n=1 Tax=Plebeiibacterium marinum TaxID=2992111 RepID=A0AAE3SLN7_9BACT|nr:BamA/TamA family outer membrane protein [Plebeiobacterium marinum]MCW3807833.1 outer membrane protein assembly factor [Plebeiobacterium marinum]